MNRLRFFRRGGLAGANGPNRFICQHDFADAVTVGMNHRCQLTLDHFFGMTGFAFGQCFADADDGRDACSQCSPGLVGHQRVTFSMVLAALGMAHYRIAAAQFPEHRRAHFPGVGTRSVRRNILRTHINSRQSRVLQFQGLNLRQVRRRHADGDLAGQALSQPGRKRGQQFFIGSQAAVHFPVSCNQLFHVVLTKLKQFCRYADSIPSAYGLWRHRQRQRCCGSRA